MKYIGSSQNKGDLRKRKIKVQDIGDTNYTKK